MGQSVPLPEGFRPGVRVQNTKTGQFGRITSNTDRATRWSIIVHVEKPTGGLSGKTAVWKFKEMKVVQ